MRLPWKECGGETAGKWSLADWLEVKQLHYNDIMKSLNFCVLSRSTTLIILLIYLGVSSASRSVGKAVSSQEPAESVKKCKNFLCTVIKLAASNTSLSTVENVKALIKKLIVSKIFCKISITRIDLI